MDDPWAGPSWSTPSKATSSMSMDMKMPEVNRTPPPPRFDENDSDPWGAPAPIPAATKSSLSAPGTPDEDGNAHAKNLVAPGWGEDAASASAHWSGGRGDDESIRREEREPEPEQASLSGGHGDAWQPSSPVGEAKQISVESKTVQQASSANPNAAAVVEASPPSPSLSIASPPAASSPAGSPVHQQQPGLSLESEGSGPSSSSTALSIPKSPSFGDDFGGFSTGPAFTTNSDSNDDPWGSGAVSGAGASTSAPRDDGWGGEDLSWGGKNQDAMPSWGGVEDDSGFGRRQEEVHAPFGQIVQSAGDVRESDTEDEEGGWGRARPVAVAITPAAASRGKEEDDWEEAQRRIRIQNERAPREKIDALAKVWTELLGGVITEELQKRTGAEELKFEETVQTLENDIADKAISLSTIPSDINTYPPVISSLVTHERYVYALQRPNPAPTSSLLHTATTRRPRRVDPLALNSSSSEPSWTSRSMLGEPDAPPAATDAAGQQEDAGRSRWSFWGKRPAPERQLTTSGGGILEVKSMSPTPSMDRQSSDIRASSISRPASRAPSISAHPSRPSSPAPSFSPPISNDQATSTMQSTPSTSLPQAPPVQPAPSAVSRFFGRLSRKQSSSAPTSGVDAKEDLELSADDISYLSEVPSMSQPPPEKGVGDLLALEPGRTEQIASLESLLSSKAAPLPKPLAPPPKGPAGAPVSNGRSSSGRFVARMKAPAPTDMDLLGDLDMSSSSSVSTVSAQSSVQQQQVSSPSVASPSSTSAWDDFLALDQSATPPARSTPPVLPHAPVTPVSAAPLVPSRSGTPAVSISPPPPPAPATIPTMSSILSVPATPVNKARPPASADFGDFDDFGTPQHASTSTFDDFGDFSAFESSPSSSAPAAAAAAAAAVASPNPKPFNFDSFTSPINSISNIQTPSKPPPVPTPSSKPTLSTPANHARPGSLDHTPTINLLTGASASKGRRWPAPASPVAPVLAPPPNSKGASLSGSGNAPNSAGFPFLSPPPPVRPVSRAGANLLDDPESASSSPAPSSAPISRDVSKAPSTHAGLGMGISNLDLTPSAVQIPPMFGGALGATSPPPARSMSSTPMLSPPQASAQIKSLAPTAQGQGIGGGGQGGLSAQDLSFFDSL
ncbi:hypothetical protein I317_05406 [Kwoniella heveanensis CBS 569]|nr:hypothetical protein I317_05406 [Kwoniella heveanensis CBS 569]